MILWDHEFGQFSDAPDCDRALVRQTLPPSEEAGETTFVS